MPPGVIDVIGYALFVDQSGNKHKQPKPAHGQGYDRG
jgi:hypothetical protein